MKKYGHTPRPWMHALTVSAMMACALTACAPQAGEDSPSTVREDSSVSENSTTTERAENDDLPNDVQEVPLPPGFPEQVPLPDLPLIDAPEYPESLQTWDLWFATDDQEADFIRVYDMLIAAGFEDLFTEEQQELMQDGADSAEVTGASVTDGEYLVGITQETGPEQRPAIRFAVSAEE